MLKVKENNSVTIKAVVRKGDNTVQNIGSWEFIFEVQYSDGTILFTKTSANPSEILITNASAGAVDIYILPVDTNDKAGNYKYEFKAIDIAGSEYTLEGPSDFIITPTIIN